MDNEPYSNWIAYDTESAYNGNQAKAVFQNNRID